MRQYQSKNRELIEDVLETYVGEWIRVTHLADLVAAHGGMRPESARRAVERWRTNMPTHYETRMREHWEDRRPQVTLEIRAPYRAYLHEVV